MVSLYAKSKQQNHAKKDSPSFAPPNTWELVKGNALLGTQQYAICLLNKSLQQLTQQKRQQANQLHKDITKQKP